jgi:uncharacterized peroxidase-related enzyme
MFLAEPPVTPPAAELYASEMRDEGYVANFLKLWARRVDVMNAFADLRGILMSTSTLTAREAAVIVCASVSSMEDAYCSLAWGERLAKKTDPATAAGVLRGDDSNSLSARERALADWARKVVKAPNDTRQQDVDLLRTAGLNDQEIFEATALAAFRVAFSTINDALGANPDAELAQQVSADVREAVRYGRPVAAA